MDTRHARARGLQAGKAVVTICGVSQVCVEGLMSYASPRFVKGNFVSSLCAFALLLLYLVHLQERPKRSVAKFGTFLQKPRYQCYWSSGAHSWELFEVLFLSYHLIHDGKLELP